MSKAMRILVNLIENVNKLAQSDIKAGLLTDTLRLLARP